MYGVGNNQFGQLGNNDTNNANWQQITIQYNYLNWTHIDFGNNFVILLTQDGQPYAFGVANKRGQLGIGSTQEPISLPTKMDISHISNEIFIDVAAGLDHSIMLTETGLVYGFGNNANGQLGLTNVEYAVKPTLIYGNGVKKISASDEFSVLIGQGNKVFAFGLNKNGQLGDGTTQTRNSAVQVLLDKEIQAISAGGKHTVYISIDQVPYSVGSNVYGQLGVGTVDDANTPLLMKLDHITEYSHLISAVATGFQHSVLMNNEGIVFTVGSNQYYQLGHNFEDNILHPIRMENLPGIAIDIEAGAYTTFYQISNYEAYRIGAKDYGSVHSIDYITNFTKINVPFIDKLKSEAFGTCIIDNYRNFFCAGNILSEYTYDKAHFDDFISTQQILQLSLFLNHSAFITTNNILYTVGNNAYGQLGDGTNIDQSIPQRIYLPEDTIVDVATGTKHTMVLTSNLGTFTAGNNDEGQLCDGTFISKNKFHLIDSQKLKMVEIASGAMHSLFLSSLGKPYGCGSNEYSQYGDGTTENSNSFREVDLSKMVNEYAIIHIYGGKYHSAMLSSNGIPYSMGRNDYGQLGIGFYSERENIAVPMNIRLANDYIVKLAVGDFFTLLLSNVGLVFSVGIDITSPKLIFSFIPKEITNSHNAVDIAAGKSYFILLDTDGSLWGVGSNGQGQLGDSTTTFRSTLTKSNNVSKCTNIFAGGESSFAKCFFNNTNFPLYCPSGYKRSFQNQNCEICSEGYACARNDMNLCQKGYYSLGYGSHGCYPCKNGTSSSIIGASVPSSCSKCQYGHYSAKEGSISCDLCSPGTYQDAIGQSSCKLCEKGRFSDEYAAIAKSYCTICPTGAYCPNEGLSSPSLCPVGTYNDILGAMSSNSCRNCFQGYLCKNGTALHPSQPCASGSYVNYNTTPPECTPCPAGEFCFSGIKKPCLEGTYSSSEASQCSPCKPGYYCFALSKSSTEHPCKPGFYCQGGSSIKNMYPCPPGSYSTGNASSCNLCGSRHYNSYWNATSCLPCDTNISCRAGSTMNIRFSPNRYQLPKEEDDPTLYHYKSFPDSSTRNRLYLLVGLSAGFLCIVTIILALTGNTCLYFKYPHLANLRLIDRFKRLHYIPTNENMTVIKTTFGSILTIVFYILTMAIWIYLISFFSLTNIVQEKSFVPFDTKQQLLLVDIHMNISFIKLHRIDLSLISHRSAGLVGNYQFKSIPSVVGYPMHTIEYTCKQCRVDDSNPSISMKFNSNSQIAIVFIDATVSSLNVSDVNDPNAKPILTSFNHILNSLPDHYLCGETHLDMQFEMNRHKQLPSFFSLHYFYHLFGVNRFIDHHFYQIRYVNDDTLLCEKNTQPHHEFDIKLHLPPSSLIAQTTENFNISLITLVSYLFSIISIVSIVLSKILSYLEMVHFHLYHENGTIYRFMKNSCNFTLPKIPSIDTFRKVKKKGKHEALSDSFLIKNPALSASFLEMESDDDNIFLN